MDRIRLTNPRVLGAECPPGKSQTFLWDEVVPRLALRVTRAGAKSFIYETKLNGQTIRTTIGNPATWTLDNARAEARRLQTLIDQGVDPRIDKKQTLAETAQQQAEAQREKMTVAEAWDAYIEARTPKWSERHLADHLRVAHPGGAKKKRGKGKTKPGALAPLLGLKLAELTPERVKAWAKAEGAKRGTQARIAFDALRAFINWCEETPAFAGLVSPEVCSKRTKRDTLPKRGAKDDCLQKEQLLAWFEAVRGLSNPTMAAYLQTLLLTGARRNELATLRWEDVDFKWNALTIHDKVEGERTIPLTPYIKALLAPLPRRNTWVFSSPKAASGRLEEPRIPHNRALAVASIEGLTLHGLRRSFGTLSEWVEVPVGVVAQIMGHKPSATAEKHYRRRSLDLLRMWHVKIEKWILQQARIEQLETSIPGLRIVEKLSTKTT